MRLLLKKKTSQPPKIFSYHFNLQPIAGKFSLIYYTCVMLEGLSAQITEDVLRLRKEQAEKFQKTEFWYANSRGWHNVDEHGIDHGVLTYLPTYKGQDFFTLAQHQLNEYRKLDLLDAGCGKGEFCLECVDNLDKGICATGIDLEPITLPYKNRVRYALAGKKIQLLSGDLHKLDQLVPDSSVDIAVSTRVLEYTADPWAIIIQIYSRLKPGGVGLLSTVPFNMNCSTDERERVYEEDVEGEEKLSNFLKNVYGMEVTNFENTHCDLAFERTRAQLLLPLSYGRNIYKARHIGVGFERVQWTTLGYKFNDEMAERVKAAYS